MRATTTGAAASSATAHLLLLFIRFLFMMRFGTAVDFHLVLLVRHSPEIAGRSLYHLVILHGDLEVLHLELPGEEHALIALALGLQLVLVCVALTVISMRSGIVLWILRVIYLTSKAALHAIGTRLQVLELLLHRLVELFQYVLFLFFIQFHVVDGLFQCLAQRRLQVNVIMIEFVAGLCLALHGSTCTLVHIPYRL